MAGLHGPGEHLHRLQPAVFLDREVFAREVGDQVTLPVPHGQGDVDDVGAGGEDRRLGFFLAEGGRG